MRCLKMEGIPAMTHIHISRGTNRQFRGMVRRQGLQKYSPAGPWRKSKKMDYDDTTRAFFKLNHTRLGRGNFIDAARPYGSDPFKQVGVGVTFDLDSRDRAVAATRGFQLRLEGTAVPELLDATSAFGTVAGAFSTYFAPNVALDPTLALRVGGKKVWGTFPFFEAAFLGGATTLRGFNEQRFAGDAAVYANAELRLFLTEFRLLLPGDFGIFGLADIGRVFLDGDASDTWHKAAGGGIWFAFIDRGSTISLAIAQSKEQRAFYASVGFML